MDTTCTNSENSKTSEHNVLVLKLKKLLCYQILAFIIRGKR